MCRTGICLFGFGTWIFLIAVANLFTITQGAESDPGVQFSVEPQDAVVSPGSVVLLPCSATARDAPVTLSWRYRADDAPTRDHLLPANDHNRRQLTNGSLLIQAMSPSAAGRYQCVATAEGVGTIVSRRAVVSVAEAWLAEQAVRTVTSVSGGVALLPCAARGPAAVRVLNADVHGRRGPGGRHSSALPLVNITVSWSKNGASITPSARSQLSSSGALEIDPLRTVDAGVYVCRLHVAGAQDRVSEPIELRVSTEAPEVETPPRFVATPTPLTVLEGASVTFDCAAIGNPKPEIIWLNKGVAIDLNDLDSRFSLVGSGSLLVLGARAVDSGAYTCRATNVLDNADVTAALHVMSPPRVTVPSHAVSAEARGDITLRCAGRGRPPPRIVWLKDGEPISPNHHDITLQDGHDLRIQGVLTVDAGMFQCSATSPAGSAVAALRLHVTQHDETQTHVPEVKSSIYTKSHQIFSTLISSAPDLPDLYPDLGEASPAFTPEPELLDRDYNALDSLHAAKGIMSANASLPAPKGLTAVIVKHTFVTLRWDQVDDKNEQIKGYEVVYRVKGSERERVSRSDTPRHEINVPSLQPNTTYEFWVRAYSDDFVSEPSEVVSARTLGEELHGATNVQGVATSPHAIAVTWRAPELTPHSYTLYYTEVESGKEQYVTVPGSETSTTVSGLRAAHVYRLRLEPGAQQTEVRTPSDVPAAPPDNVTATAVSSTSVLVRWSAPPSRTHRGVLTGYKVRYRAEGAAGGALTTPADTKSLEIKGLAPGETYQVRVCALNANGSGPFSEWTSVRTLLAEHASTEDVPPAPPPLTTRAGRDWISVQWGPPAAPAPGGWTLSWGLGVPDEHEVTLPAGVTQRVVRNLKANSEYVVAVRALSALGPGPAVYATVRTAHDHDQDHEDYEDDDYEDENEEPPPIPPVGLKVIMLSGTTAVVYWTDPTLPKGQPPSDARRYVVRYAAGSARPKYFNTSEINCMIYDLKPYTTYDFAVKLIKGGVESTWSLLVSNTSLEAAPSSPPRELHVEPAPPGLAVTWTPPLRPNGLITGYTIMYAAMVGGSDPPPDAWSALEVSGTRRGAVLALPANTRVAVRVQAYTSKGRGPFCPPVTALTPPAEALSANGWLWASVGAAGVVMVGAGAAGISLCGGGRGARGADRGAEEARRKTRDGLKPPDLWIHHDQMELKCVDKLSAGSIEGVQTSTLTRAPPVDYEPARHAHPAHPASLDRRYVPTYVASRRASYEDDAELAAYPRYYSPMSGVSVACSATCDRRLPRHPDQSTPLLSAVGMSPHSSVASLQPPCVGGGACPLGPACSVPGLTGVSAVPGLPTPGHDVYAVAARERGHYVAYEPLGGYTHRDSLGSELTASTLRRCAAGAAPGLGLHMSDASSGHSTPSHDKGSIRESSPYKQSATSSPAPHLRLPIVPGVPEPVPELEGLTPSRSSERLQKEMDNLEGLMKDLSSITHQHYHC